MNLKKCAVFLSFIVYAGVWADSPLPDDRLRGIALRGTFPQELDKPAQRALETVRLDLERKQTDAALDGWKKFVEGLAPARVPACADYLLNRVATARNSAANAACRKVRFYDAQESAVFEHVSTVDKQLSAYNGADVQALPLREPELADYAPDAEPVKFAAGISAGPRELKASLDRWNERLPAISELRQKAIDDFVAAIRADTALLAELAELDTKLKQIR
jgi:hypothetical protein